MTNSTKQRSFTVYRTVAMAVDPIHVGTGGSRLGRVDNSIVRDPVTRIPKIPGSSLAGVHRAYAAMALEDERIGGEHKDPRGDKGKDKDGSSKPFYPNCAGQGQAKDTGHCGDPACPICSTFGHQSFAGLAAFSDAQVLLFPVPTREGPVWVTSPGALRFLGVQVKADQDVVHRETDRPLNLGWLLLPRKEWSKAQDVKKTLNDHNIHQHLLEALALVSDKLFGHVVNSNLEVRTSVAINPATGAAEDGALFTYEALPRGTVLAWDVTCRDPRHFGPAQGADPHGTVERAHPLLEALGIGGMGSRGMGRMRVLSSNS
jgi:CRISPR-associated protein Cmr4